MQRITLPGVTLGLLLLCTGVLLASEADGLRERAQAMRKKASVVAEQGNKELAERLERESVELLETAERLELKAKGRGEQENRPSIDKEVQQLKERLKDLLAKKRNIQEVNATKPNLDEVHTQIVAMERELKQIYAKRGENRPEFLAQAEKLSATSRRIQHLRAAAENLNLADEPDLAHKLMEQAEKMERDLEVAKQQLTVARQEASWPPREYESEVVWELRTEIERLRAVVKELSQRMLR